MNAEHTFLVIHPDDVQYLVEQGFTFEQRDGEWGFYLFEPAAREALKERGSRQNRRKTP